LSNGATLPPIDFAIWSGFQDSLAEALPEVARWGGK